MERLRLIKQMTLNHQHIVNVNNNNKNYAQRFPLQHHISAICVLVFFEIHQCIVKCQKIT